MQEFSSVTASSYDAESLAPLLNEKAADGWSVVSIVAAGTNIVAYLQRETDGAPAVETPAVETPVEETPVEEMPVEETPAVDEPAADAPFIPAAAAVDAVEEAPAAVDEPAGWASAPDEAADAAADTSDSSIADLAAQVSEPEPEPEPEPAVAEPAAEAAPAAESTVPAGWYADPSGRFELRYWDGAAWTEHVSRAGQQFTDPPVA
jgi:hypothetical protein